VDVVFEEADLARLEHVKQRAPDIIHELVFHPSAVLASTWQPWDGVLGPQGGHSRRVARARDVSWHAGPRPRDRLPVAPGCQK
jgi:hypothetical protein